MGSSGLFLSEGLVESNSNARVDRILHDIHADSPLSSGISLVNFPKFDGSSVDALDFSGLPTGTHKYYKAIRAIRAFLQKNDQDVLVAISSGNYAQALKAVAEAVDRKVVLVTSFEGGLHNCNYLRGDCTSTVPIEDLQDAFSIAIGNGSFEKSTRRNVRDLTGKDLVRAYSAWRLQSGDVLPEEVQVWNATNLLDLESLEYGSISSDRFTYGVELGDSYDYVFCPNGSGELLYSLMCDPKLKDAVFYGISPFGHPSITGSTFEEDYRGSSADKLCSPTYSILNTHLRNKIRRLESGVPNLKILDISEREIGAAADFARVHGFSLESSASVPFAFFDSNFRIRTGLQMPVGKKVLLVLTGNGALDRI